MLRKKQGVIPVLRINNRQINQTFFEKELGMKTHLEEGPFVELGAYNQASIGLVLVESPSYRTRAVRGIKKLRQLLIRVEDAKEIESLLARGTAYTKLYQGKKGFAFEAVSPEGDTFLLHAEESVDDLTAILPSVSFEAQAAFTGLSSFYVERVQINSPKAQAYMDFYNSLFPDQVVIQAVEAQGEDLVTDSEKVWDVTGFRFAIPEECDWATVENKLTEPFFKDRKGRFIQTTDPSGIELWLEK